MSKTTLNRIKLHWAPWLVEVGKFDSENEIFERESCFACTMPDELERCHIVARVVNGNDDVSNLHLLCRPCHYASEMLSGDSYLRWFLARTPMDKMMDRYLVQSHRERTKQGLKRAKDNGLQLGRPVLISADVAGLMIKHRKSGMTFAEIATALNSESITTPTGKTWAANNVADTLRRNGGDPAPRRRGPRVAAKVTR